MQIKEVEEKTGLTRSNIRFYEKQNLLSPCRNQNSGYREYSEEDVMNIKKIAYLRTLGISVNDIQSIIKGEDSLLKIVKRQEQVLSNQIDEFQNAKKLCERMLLSNDVNYENMHVEDYITEMEPYWKANAKIFKIDSVSFIYLWGGLFIWGILTAICFIVSLLSFPDLPDKIPVQWSGNKVSSEVSRVFMFAYPVICVVIRLILRPFIRRWLQQKAIHSDAITNYLTNFMCFVALSIQVFTLLYINEIVSSVSVLLLVDIVIFMGVLLSGWKKVVYNPN